ncbi:MAG TPA: endolytic transglycosylase MltG [Gaiellaceae bacterium]|nr:endolytic transglycosylase MltG [Gaiellaceae bacterium]
MAEPRKPVMPPVRRPPERPSAKQLRTRRLVAALVFVVVVAAGVGIAFAAMGRGGSSAPATTAALPPPPKPLRIIFPEGFTIAQMAQRITAVDRIARRKRHVNPKLRATQYLKLTRNAPFPPGFGHTRGKLEGFLFPATYDFLEQTTTKQLVADQLKAFRESWAKLDLRYARSKNLTPYDVLIIASMVEKETLAPDERPLVASVIYNRLHAHMPLGIDATLRYGLDIPGTEAIHESQLQNPTPYNTRLHAGLPPTPIANPGLASLQAAAHPRKTKYLYFVRKPDKVHHFFTASGSEFLKKECEYGYGCG